jgi:hypothetical protein
LGQYQYQVLIVFGVPMRIDNHLMAKIQTAVASISCGTVQITVHAGKVVQIEQTQRMRFEASQDLNEPEVLQ